MNHNKSLSDLNFKNRHNFSKFFIIIKKEYFRNLFKILILLVVLFTTIIIYFILSYQLIVHNVRLVLDQVVVWFLFLVCTLVYFFQLSAFKFSPTLMKFLQKEINKLDFEVRRKYKVGFSFFIYSCVTIIIFIILLVNFSLNNILASLIIRLLIVYFFSSIVIPILRGILHDKFVIKLRWPYFIQIDLQFKLIKHIDVESQMIRIYMTSNKLGLKSDRDRYKIYTNISNERWLPRKGKSKLRNFFSFSHLFFFEYSTIINFNEHFLNLVSAIREWDITFKKITQNVN